ncbi:MAG: aminotransferase class III-fold pyridoxal phosphate-dependent enzyme, partial [SAR202 cluster bacterium]|nr:aminotransferase class III-fold pyridoxal phosphate-dependent enzyme [SAR202 cluster bacterium]
MDVESKYYMFLVRRQPVVIERGEGTRVWDVDGKEYLDFTSGWAVNNVGHANTAVADAIAEQAKTLLQTSNQFYTVPQLKLAEILVENSAMDKVFFCNSGTEANEGAIKLARRYGATRRNGAFEIITALNS